MIFKQYDYKLNRKSFEIKKDGLKIISNTINTHSEEFYDFEVIGNIQSVEKKQYLLPLILAAVFFGVAILIHTGAVRGDKLDMDSVALYYFMAFLCLNMFFFLGKNAFYLSKKDGSTSIEFLNNRPTKEKLMEFVTELQRIKRCFLLANYAEFDELKNYHEHVAQLRWLLEAEYITKKEYKTLLSRIDKHFQEEVVEEGGRASIGFLAPENEEGQKPIADG